MSEDWGVEPPDRWSSVDIKKVAERFDVLPFTVRRIMRETEITKREELEVKIKTRMRNVSEYLHLVYDSAAAEATCSKCGRKGFDTWDEMQAHVLAHLMTENLDDAKFAGVAQRVAAAADKALYPALKVSMRQKRQGILPPDEDPIELAERVHGRIGPGKS